MDFEASNLEKGSANNVDSQCGAPNISPSLSQSENTLDKKRVLRLDLLLVPMMSAIYLLAFLDRANIGNARIAGLQDDLKLTDHQYQTG